MVGVVLAVLGALVPAGVAQATPRTLAPVSAAVPIAAKPPLPKPDASSKAAADGEVRALRTERSKTFVEPGGARRLRTFAWPVHVRDAAGSWQDVDTSLVADVGAGRSAVRSKTAGVSVRLPGSLRQPVRVQGNDASVAFTLRGAGGGAPEVSGSSALYRDVLAGVDVDYRVLPTGVKEDLVLADAAAAQALTFQVSLSSGLRLTSAGGGGLAVLDKAGRERFSVPAPTVAEADGPLLTAPVRYELTDDSTVSVVVDPEWLNDPARRFPVRVDPTVFATGPAAATFLSQAAPTTSQNGTGEWRLGSWSGSSLRALVRFDLSTLPRDVDVLSSAIGGEILAGPAGQAPSADVDVQALPVTRSWTAAATWQSPDGTSGSSWTTPGGDVGPVASTVTHAAGDDGLSSLVSSLVPGWVSDPGTNNGVMLQVAPGSPSGVLTLDSSQYTPYLDVAYAERIGRRPFFTSSDVPLTDRMGLSVNLGSGNLRLSVNELKVAGIGGDLSVDRVWDSLDLGRVNAQPLLQHWSLTPGKDLRLMEYADGILAVGPDVTYGWYPKVGSGSSATYTTPPGVELDLVKAGSGYPSGYLMLRDRTTSQKWIFGYYGLLTETVDRNGNTVTFGCNGLGYDARMTSIVDTRGRTVTLGYNSAGLVTSLKDSSGRQTSYGYDPSLSYLTSTSDPAGKTTLYGYNAQAMLTSVTDPRGLVTVLSYDGRGRVASLMQVTSTSGPATGPTTTYAYTDAPVSHTDASGQTSSFFGKTVVTDPNGHATTYFRDSSSRVLRTVDALGHARSRSFTSAGSVSSAVDALGSAGSPGNTSTFTYDSDNRRTTDATPTGAAGLLSYAEPAGTVSSPAVHWQPASRRDADGSTTSVDYDAAGNVVRTQDTTDGPTGGVALTYALAGNAGVASCGGRSGQTGQVCASTDGRGTSTGYTYNSLGELISIDHPAPLGDESFGYDGLSRLTTKTDGKGQTTRYSYDLLDRSVQVRLDGSTSCTNADITAGRCVTYGYDVDGNPTHTTDQTGTTTVTFDRLNREISRSLPSTGTTSLSYDAAGNVLTATDAAGTLTYGYNDANQLTSLKEPGGSCSATPKDRCTTFGYDANGTRTSTTYPTGSTSTVMAQTPDASGRVSRIKTTTGSLVQSDLSYGYSRQVGGVATDGTFTRSRTDNTAVGAAGKTTGYGYDSLSRLTSAVEKNTAGSTTASWAYAYDAAGNRVQATLSPAGTGGTTTLGYNQANQLTDKAGTGGFTYDGTGAETAAYGATHRTAGVWNAKQQQTSVTVSGTTHTRGYSGLGNQLRLTAGNTSFRNTALGVTAQTTSGNTTTFVRDPAGTLVAMRTGGVSHYYLHDNLGSTIGLISNTGTKTASYTYDPYGQTRTATGSTASTNPYRYTGGQLDSSTGLYKLGVRYYDSTLGRFTQPDPTRQDTQYVYGLNSPTSYTDPTGAASCAESATTGLLAAIGTGAAIGGAVTATTFGAGAAVGLAATIAGGVYGVGAAARDCL